MEPYRNPFGAVAGSRPPERAGRAVVMGVARVVAASAAFLSPRLCSAQEKNDLGKWTPYFRTDQILSGDVVVEPGKISWDRKLHLTIGSPGVVIGSYRRYSATGRAVAYPVHGDARHVILRKNLSLVQ